ncbi:glycosyltransferase family 2 protein [Leptolyngbya cf. ectocarpi LEGE 11479]|uniref:Glycosyltransferase family 2 protein n=1 Tax=Leptolyngbya cf. ectocarpi LEGE 11479 TaxID=1828722 RepID=A0A928ZYE7_LEPEC|nr:glycosyltransferase family 2 protein [Leptolyngbya ectocarpi]MBE9069779.1 glycosyltransferase family 2 protein [Leptolyngbya cf. ectocarpi LEGE 11479]
MKTLAIAVPTYNRSQLLDKQLNHLFAIVEAFGSDCEIFISNNCSTDDTAQVIEKWSEKFAPIDFRTFHQSENIGAIRNIATCIRSVTAKHIWVLSDDDTVLEGALPYVMGALNKLPDIGLITLNFAGRDYNSKKLVYERRYPLEESLYDKQGQSVFEKCVRMEGGVGGLALTSAQIYRTDLAQKALEEWQAGLDNLAVQVYVTGYCAKYGGAQVTKDAFIECSLGNHFFVDDRAVSLKMTFSDVPSVYQRLVKIGYSKELFRQMTHRKLGEFSRVFASKKKLLKTFLKYPITMTNVISQLLLRSV